MYIKRKIVVLAMTMLCLMALTATAWASDGDSTWDKIKDAASDAKDTIVENAPGVIESAKEAGGKLVDAAKEKGPEVLDAAKEGLENAQEAVTDFRQQQEDQFWGWFSNQINPNKQKSDGSDTSDTESDQTSAADSGTSSDKLANASDIYYYDPNQQTNETPTDTASNTVASASTANSGPLVQDYHEDVIPNTATEQDAQGPASGSSNALPSLFPQTTNSTEGSSNAQTKSQAPDVILIITIVVILVGGFIIYRKILKL